MNPEQPFQPIQQPQDPAPVGDMPPAQPQPMTHQPEAMPHHPHSHPHAHPHPAEHHMPASPAFDHQSHAAYHPTPAQPVKLNTFKLYALLAGAAALLIIAGLSYALVNAKKSNSTNGTSANHSSAPAAKHNVAASLDDYKVVCQGSTISNASSYSADNAGPHPMSIFEQGSGSGSNKSYTTSSAYLGEGATPDYNAPGSVQLVGCLTRKTKGTFVKNCDLQDSKKKTVTLKLTAAMYDLDIYAAKTGQKVAHTTIDQTSDTCPYLVFIDTSDPTYYASPDSQTIKVAVQAYTQ